MLFDACDICKPLSIVFLSDLNIFKLKIKKNPLEQHLANAKCCTVRLKSRNITSQQGDTKERKLKVIPFGVSAS